MFSFQNRNPFKRNSQSHMYSLSESTANFSITNSTVTPQFGSFKKDQETLKMAMNNKFANYDKYQNTQQYIQKLVQSNQNQGIFGFGDGFIESEEGFNFSEDQSKQQQFGFYNPQAFDNAFNFTGNFGDEIEPIYEINHDQRNNQLSKFSNFENFSQDDQDMFQDLEGKDQRNHSFGSFQFETFNQLSNETKRSNKKLSCASQFFKDKKEIIYQVDSKLQYEGLTNQLFPNSQTISLNTKNVTSNGEIRSFDKRNSIEYNKLRESLIQELSQMDSDEWNSKKSSNRSQEIQIETKIHNIKENQNLSSKLNSSSLTKDQKPVNQSIIQQLFSNSIQKSQNQLNQPQKVKNLKRTRNLFSLRNQEKKVIPYNSCYDIQKNSQVQNTLLETDAYEGNKNKEKEKRRSNFYESEVVQLTLQSIDDYKNQNKKFNFVRNFPLKTYKPPFIQKPQNAEQTLQANSKLIQSAKKEKLQKLNFFEKKSSDEKKQLIRDEKPKDLKIQNLHLNQNQSEASKSRFRFEIKTKYSSNRSAIVNQKQEYKVQQNEKANQFLSQNISFSNQLDEPSIPLYQSAAKPSIFGRKQKKKSSQNSLQKFKINDDNHQSTKIPDSNHKNQANNVQLFKKVNKPDCNKNISNDHVGLSQISGLNLRKKPLNFVSTKLPTEEKETSQYSEVNSNRKSEKKNKTTIGSQFVQNKPYKNLELVSKSSKSSENGGVTIDTKGFLDRVLNQNQRNTNNISGNKKPKFQLNFKRRKIFSSKIDTKQTPLIKSEKENQQKVFNHKQLIETTNTNKNQEKNADNFASKSIQKKGIEQKVQRQTKNSSSYHKDYQSQNNYESQSSHCDQQVTKMVIPKFTFTKKTPQKKQLEMNAKKDSANSQIVSNYEQTLQRFNRKNSVFSSNQNETILRKRQNYLMNSFNSQNKQLIKEIDNSNDKSKESEFPTISSSKQSEFINQVEDLIGKVQMLRQKIDRKKMKQKECNRRISSLNAKVKDLFNQKSIGNLMNWKHQ